MTNDNKICFIMCANKEDYETECRNYIEHLEIPQGMEVEIKSVWNATSMASGYNKAMTETDAKYKMYLHQDVFLLQRDMIQRIVDLFKKNQEIGMLGVLGGYDLPNTGIIYSAWNVGLARACDTQIPGIKQCDLPEQDVQIVEALDGMILITQYDVRWREDLFDKWDFYDISQCFEFRKEGYKVGVVRQDEPWTLHDCGRTKLSDYDAGRKKLLSEYGDFFREACYREEDFEYHYELKKQFDSWKDKLECFYLEKKWDEMLQIVNQYDDTIIQDTELSLWRKMLSIGQEEQQLYGNNRFLQTTRNKKELFQKYTKVKFYIWQIENDMVQGRESTLNWIKENTVSALAMVKIAYHNSYQFDKVLTKLQKIYQGQEKDESYIEMIQSRLHPEKVEKKNPQTESEIAEVEQLCNIKASIRNKCTSEYREKINELLKKKDQESQNRLLDFLNGESFEDAMRYVTEFAYMIVSAGIFQSEKQENAAVTIWDVCDSMEEVEQYIIELKFLLWRFEFNKDEAAGNKILEFMQRRKSSEQVILYMVHTASMDKTFVLEKLAVLFLDQNKYGMAFSMLKYINELTPGREDVLCSMADLCMQAGQKEQALFCLNQIENPGETAIAYRKMCANE